MRIRGSFERPLLNDLLAFRVFQVKVELQAMLVHRDFL